MGRLRKKGKAGPLLLLGVIWIFFYGAPGAAADVIYDGPRAQKAITKPKPAASEASKEEPKTAPEKASKEGPRKASKDSKDKGKEAAEESAPVYVFDPTGKADPFKPFIAKQEPVEPEEERKRKPRTYLETLDISQLDLIAVVTGEKGDWAMVRDAKGLGYVIKKGTPIGVHNGVVEEVRDREVIILEKYRDFRGEIQVRRITKKLVAP